MYIGPKIFNVYKPVDRSSQEIVFHFKKNLPPGFGKIGHFGTLDPFAEGVLMIGVNGAARLNDYIHEFLPKTYIATGILGIETPTGDTTVEASNHDDSESFKNEISKLSLESLNKSLREKFIGEYMQAPHHFSAAKHEGKALHQWAREGVKIDKEKKKKTIYDLKVLEYNFPEVLFEVSVSSGTYVRTLFSDMANFIGTIGTLKKLVRHKVGEITSSDGLQESVWPMNKTDWDIEQNSVNLETLLPFSKYHLTPEEFSSFKHGRELNTDLETDKPIWVMHDNSIIGLGTILDQKLRAKINFFKV